MSCIMFISVMAQHILIRNPPRTAIADDQHVHMAHFCVFRGIHKNTMDMVLEAEFHPVPSQVMCINAQYCELSTKTSSAVSASL